MSNTNSFMNTPLFKVGELVGLVSVNRPECNGQYIVERVLDPNEVFASRNDGKYMHNGSDFPAYLLSEIFISKYGYGEACWNESALRKIHKPSEYSYQELLTSLKETDKIPSNV